VWERVKGWAGDAGCGATGPPVPPVPSGERAGEGDLKIILGKGGGRGGTYVEGSIWRWDRWDHVPVALERPGGPICAARCLSGWTPLWRGGQVAPYGSGGPMRSCFGPVHRVLSRFCAPCLVSVLCTVSCFGPVHRVLSRFLSGCPMLLRHMRTVPPCHTCPARPLPGPPARGLHVARYIYTGQQTRPSVVPPVACTGLCLYYHVDLCFLGVLVLFGNLCFLGGDLCFLGIVSREQHLLHGRHVFREQHLLHGRHVPLVPQCCRGACCTEDTPPTPPRPFRAEVVSGARSLCSQRMASFAHSLASPLPGESPRRLTNQSNTSRSWSQYSACSCYKKSQPRDSL
jgi:hypothetical protein